MSDRSDADPAAREARPAPDDPGRAGPGPVVLAFALDLLCIVGFVVVGRRSHHEDAGWAGFVRVAWPFVVGLGIATLLATWGGSSARRWPPAWSRAVVVWLGTVVVGVGLRVVALEHDLVLAFVVVTTAFLGVTMLGWRAVVRLVVRRATRVRA